MYRLMATHKGYEQLTDEQGRPFSTFTAFCLARPPYGLGMPPEVIDRLIQDRKTAQARAQQPALLLSDSGPMTAQERESIANDVSNRVTQRGNDATYLTARIARDRPDILDRMKEGRYPSVRAAAAIQGGGGGGSCRSVRAWRKPRRRRQYRGAT